MMSDWLIDRIATALTLKLREIEEDVRAGELTEAEIQALAVAVLTEMRVPTPRMLNAAGGAMSAGKRPTERYVGNKAKHGIRYRAMIDAELRWHERVKPPAPSVQPLSQTSP